MEREKIVYKTTLFIIAVFALVNGVFAQPFQSPEDQIRTSTIVPDLHNANGDWIRESRRDANLVVVSYKSKNLILRGSEEYYVNVKDKMIAYLWLKMDANGNREEFAMLYGTDNVARGAIKSGGRWYVSKELYFDNSQTNPNGSVSPELVYDDKEADRPVKVMFILETVVGPKEVVFDFQ